MKKLSREEFDAGRMSYWPKGGAAEATTLALLADIHTMLEHLLVEPKVDDEQWGLKGGVNECDNPWWGSTDTPCGQCEGCLGL